ncbi:MAG: PepSY domain-containing protein [Nitrosotalea sp.]
MNAKNLTVNHKMLAIIIGVAIIATAGVTAASAQVQGTPTTQPPTIQGSINLQQTIMSNVQTKFSAASDTAASAVTNGKTIGGSLTVAQGYVVYSFKVIDDKNMVYSVIVDPANGKVLYTSPGHAFQLGGFGMGQRSTHGQTGAHTWNSQKAPSGTTTPSSGLATPSGSQS